MRALLGHRSPLPSLPEAPAGLPARARAAEPSRSQTPLHAIASWGRVKRLRVPRITPAWLDQLEGMLARARATPVLAMGLGRSYGDSCLNGAGTTLDMTALDRVIAFDPITGVIRAEAGLSLSDLLRVVVPYGWFLPTTPGTRFVTLGGAVANDVHGKNHHAAATFGASVRRIGLLRSDQGALDLSPSDNTELFRATVAGLGLTGLIAWVELQLVRVPSSYLAAENVPFGGYGEFASIARDSAERFEHTVAWIDCTTGKDGKSTRGLFSRANWLPDGLYRAHDDRTRAALPMELPGFTINPLSLKAFNTLYYTAGRMKRGRTRVHYAPFFYPLDAIRNWNRAYGKAGFYQYQCVVPSAVADTAIPDLLGEIARAGQGSCLAVLKTFGDKPSPGLLSFPHEGVTLALDFPNRKARTHALFERLDAIVAEANGRLYPAKDGRMPAALFRAGYPELPRFAAQVDPHFNSDFWRRMNP
jgi:L-gulonolactone oxidase